MAILARCKTLRGTAFDLFGYTAERQAERVALTRYEILLDDVAARLTAANYTAAVQLVSVPEQIRGFGPVRHAHLVASDKAYAIAQAKFDKASDIAAGGSSERKQRKQPA